MKDLQIKSIELDSNGVLKVETNISDNLELAKYVDKNKMEKCLNNHPLEMHIYQNEHMISSVSYRGVYMPFDIRELMEFLEKKHKTRRTFKQWIIHISRRLLRKGYCNVCGQELTEIRGKYPKQPRRKVCACCATEKLEWIEEQVANKNSAVINARTFN